jgi:hypothetical protein
MRSLILLVLLACVAAELVGYYHLDSTKGNIAYDSSDWENSGIFEGKADGWSSLGKRGGCYRFGLYDENALLERMPALNFSLSFWMKTSQPGRTGQQNQWWNGDGLVDAEMPNAVNDFGTSLVGGKIAFGLGPQDTTIFSSTIVVSNTPQWHHVVATRGVSPDALTNTIRLYIDSILEADLAQNVNTQLRDAPTELAFGSLQTGVNTYNGFLDEVRIYDHELTQEEVIAIFVEENNDGLEGDANKVTDAPTNGYDTKLTAIETIQEYVGVPDKGPEIAAIVLGVFAIILLVAAVVLTLVILRKRK